MTVCYQNNVYLCKSADRYGVMSYRHEEAYASSAFLYCRHNIKVGNMEQKEEWKPVVGYEGLYEVSNLGRIKSVERVVRRGRYSHKVKECIKTQVLNTNGYPCVSLCKNGKSRQKTIHQLIANAFINNPLNLPEIDHKNADRTDYSIDNLQWVTHRENMNNPISKQRILINSNTKEAVRKMIESRIINGGDTSPKRVYQFTKEGEFIAEYESSREAGRATGLDATTISTVSRGGLRGRQSCGGYLWSRSKDIIPEYKPYKKNYKPILQYTKDWIFVKRWDSIKEAGETLGLAQSNIGRSASGRKKYLCGGYHWEYEK